MENLTSTVLAPAPVPAPAPATPESPDDMQLIYEVHFYEVTGIGGTIAKIPMLLDKNGFFHGTYEKGHKAIYAAEMRIQTQIGDGIYQERREVMTIPAKNLREAFAMYPGMKAELEARAQKEAEAQAEIIRAANEAQAKGSGANLRIHPNPKRK